MVECTALEMRRGGNSTGGSNPSLSATYLKIVQSKQFLMFWPVFSTHISYHIRPVYPEQGHWLATCACSLNERDACGGHDRVALPRLPPFGHRHDRFAEIANTGSRYYK